MLYLHAHLHARRGHQNSYSVNLPCGCWELNLEPFSSPDLDFDDTQLTNFLQLLPSLIKKKHEGVCVCLGKGSHYVAQDVLKLTM